MVSITLKKLTSVRGDSVFVYDGEKCPSFVSLK